MRTLKVRRINREEGGSLVEFALVSFMFIILLLSVVEMGRMILVYTTVANAARAGARYAIVHGQERTGSGVNGPSGPGNTSQVQSVVQNFASAGLVDTSPIKLHITVSYPNGSNAAGSPVSVTVTYDYDPILGYFKSILNKTLGSTSQGVITF